MAIIGYQTMPKTLSGFRFPFGKKEENPASEKSIKPQTAHITIKPRAVGVSSAQMRPATKPEVLAVVGPAHLKQKIEAEILKASQASIINLVSDLVHYANMLRASDIHLDPAEKSLRARLRVDGILQEAFQFPKNMHNEIITRIKILSALRIDEHQAAQDGRFRLTVEEGKGVDIRVSVAPTFFGENAVLRLLSDKEENHTLESLGFSADNREKILAAIKKPFGMILATGPTGSGKTTTMYTILKMLNRPEVSIITIEDPIEYAIGGIEQIQVNARTGLSFASGLRSILRQDPNIIMVGEVRDGETAGIAINVALTGHLLLSTLHTNDPATTLPRLLDMGVEAYLVASTINVVIGQRLVRRVCPACRVGKKLTLAEAGALSGSIPSVLLKKYKTFYKGEGCGECNNTGYKGRISLHEVMVINEPLREAILQKMPAAKLRQVALGQGMVSMLEDGLEKAAQGITSLEEILRVISEG